MIKTIYDSDFKIISDDYEFKYQEAPIQKIVCTGLLKSVQP